ncbi:MAG: carboxylating nicotinate-nucleotide diphosphorylase [Candidatus Bathyarchaeia archaeon]|jgi:nicotinate-nucleotide pyrophosphorylase (carboxylating)
MFVPRKILEEKLRQILADDIGLGDVTAQTVIPANLIAEAVVVAKEEGVAAGIEEATVLAESLDLKVKAKVVDGEKIKNKQVLMEISGDARTILSAERTILNIVSRMSGIATATRTLTEKLQNAGFKAKIAATRKSAPGLLYFDKRAVVIGGGDPHRLHLDDMVLIKDNHVAIVGSPEEAVKKARANVSFTKKIEVEVTKVSDVLKVAQAGADAVMLDNFSIEQVKEAADLLEKAGFLGKVVLEASGGITAEDILDYAAAKVDVISIGHLTHSVKALDASLEIVQTHVKSA